MSLGSILCRLLPKRLRYWLLERDLRRLEAGAVVLPQDDDSIPCIFVEETWEDEPRPFTVTLAPSALDKGLN